MDEKKSYAVVGKVEIGTDEYRDLIEDTVRYEKEVDEYRSKYWDIQSKNTKLEGKIEFLENKISQYKKFITNDPERVSAFNMFIAKTAVDVDEEEY